MSDCRLQVAVVLPESVASPIQRVRSRHDPVMAAKIPPHVTLIYEVPDELLLAQRLATACADASPFQIRLEGPRCWGNEPGGGIYLPVEDSEDGIESLRRSVLTPPFVEPPHIVYQPHVTLVHPRTVSRDGLGRAWSELAGCTVPMQDARIDSVAVISSSGDRPVIMETYGLASV